MNVSPLPGVIEPPKLLPPPLVTTPVQTPASPPVIEFLPGFEVLRLALQSDNPKHIENFMKKNPNWNLLDPVAPQGNTLFHLACKSGKIKIAAFLLNLARAKDIRVDMESAENEEGKFAYDLTTRDIVNKILELAEQLAQQ